MTRPISTAVEIDAPPSVVWDELSCLETHVEWMADAVALEFHTEQRRGVGTAFSCATKIGPLRTTDEMTIDRWDEGTAIGVTHRGAVTGSGVFELAPRGDSATSLTWTERLVFPFWMGGALGAFVARPAFRWIWKRNLERLRSRVTDR